MIICIIITNTYFMSICILNTFHIFWYLILSTTLWGKHSFSFIEKKTEKFSKGLPTWHSGKESTCQYRRCRKCGLDPWARKISWSRKWQPTAVFLPGKFHGQTEPWGRKTSDTAEWLSTHTQSLNTQSLVTCPTSQR